MTLTITKQNKNDLLARTEVQANLTFGKSATPSNADVAKQIANSLKTKEELVVMRHLYTHYGKNEAEIEAYVYDSQDALKSIEIIPAKTKKEIAKKEAEAKKKALEEKKAAEEAAKKEAEEKEKAAEEAKKEAEKPVEAPKEEVKPTEEAKPAETPKEEAPAQAQSSEAPSAPNEEKKE